MTSLGAPMTGDGIRGEPLSEQHREDLKGACAEDTARPIVAIATTQKIRRMKRKLALPPIEATVPQGAVYASQGKKLRPPRTYRDLW